jgi:hypothetical protein
MPISSQDVLNAFDSLGGAQNHSQALRAKLRQQGFEDGEIIDAINDLAAQGVLSVDSMGQIRRV